MNYIFNNEKIKQLLYDFFLSTGIAVTFYDSSMNMIATLPTHSPYCQNIRQKKECLKNCTISNLVHMKQASSLNQTVSYTCHAGLMETIIPVTYEDTLIGYMQIGQFRDKEEIFSSPKTAQNLLEKYKINTKTALKLYRDLPIVSAEKLSSLKEILFILIKHFWEEGLIHHNRSMLSVKIEQFVQEHIKEKLTVSNLCEHFYLSKNSLYHLFATEFNTTVSDYVLTKRIQNSIKMLKESDSSITMIASECGFTDYNYFIRAFKKQVGITPLQFRKTNTP